MNTHLKRLRNHVITYQEALNSYNKQKADLDNLYKSGEISKNSYELKLDRLEDQKPASTIRHDISNLINEYENELNNWAVMNGADLDQDLALFNSPIRLQAKDYQLLEAKHKDNYTMLKAIKDHAASNSVHYAQTYSVDTKEKVNVLKELQNVAHNIVRTLDQNNKSSWGDEDKANKTSYLGILWSDEEKFNNLYEDHSNKLHIKE